MIGFILISALFFAYVALTDWRVRGLTEERNRYIGMIAAHRERIEQLKAKLPEGERYGK